MTLALGLPGTVSPNAARQTLETLSKRPPVTESSRTCAACEGSASSASTLRRRWTTRRSRSTSRPSSATGCAHQSSIPTSGPRCSSESRRRDDQAAPRWPATNTATASSTTSPISSPSPEGTARRVEGDALRRPPGASLPRLLAGALGVVRCDAGASRDALSARNITVPGGMLEIGRKNVAVDPSGEFRDEQEIGDVLIADRQAVAGLSARPRRRRPRLREPADVPELLHGSRPPDERVATQPRITLAVQMRSGQQIGEFGRAVDARSADVLQQLPEDLIVARTSRSAAAGRRERRPLHEQPLRGDRARRARRADRLLGVALGAADGAVDSRSRWR